MSFTNLPYRRSGPHGGISRVVTFWRIDFDQGRTCSYLSRDIGATSPGRWQLTHFVNRIGATSFEKVGAASAAAAVAALASDIVRPRVVAHILRFMSLLPSARQCN